MRRRRSAILFAIVLAVASPRARAGIPVVAPVITSSAAADGAAVSDTAHVSGGANPTGSLTFTLYGPNDATCGNPPISSEILSVNGDGDYQTDSVIVPSAGTYRWTLSYGGDPANAPVTVPCNAANESVTIVAVTPRVTSTASPNVPVGGLLSDTAHLSGGNAPTGEMHFLLYGPDDATCSNLPVFNETVPVTGNGSVESDFFIASEAGTYRWIVSYGGDGANDPVTMACNDPGESVVVGGTAPVVVPTLGPGVLALLAALLAGVGAWRARN